MIRTTKLSELHRCTISTVWSENYIDHTFFDHLYKRLEGSGWRFTVCDIDEENQFSLFSFLSVHAPDGKNNSLGLKKAGLEKRIYRVLVGIEAEYLWRNRNQ